jgi:hypothetical protein
MNSTGSFSQETITDLDTIYVSLYNPGGHPLDSHCRTCNGVLAGQQLYLPCDVYRYDNEHGTTCPGSAGDRSGVLRWSRGGYSQRSMDVIRTGG